MPVMALLALMAAVLPAQTDSEGTPGLKYTLLKDGKGYSVDKGKVKAGAVVIPDSYNNLPVTTIAPKAFSSSAITGITIPESVTSIGDQAFKSCKNLTGITIPNSVITMGKEVFDSCKSLASVTIGNGVTTIGKQAFYKCASLTSVTIGNSVTGIGEKAFSQCAGLTSITIPNSVTTIGKEAFYSCSSLASITIGNSVTGIGEKAFSQCAGLTSITIPNSVTSIGEKAFSQCDKLTSITIPDSVTRIQRSAFEACKNLTSVTIGNGVTSIDECAFLNCTRLTSVTIGNSVTSIREWAFSNCTSLTSVTIPSSVTRIEQRAFQNDYQSAFDCRLTSITFQGRIKSTNLDSLNKDGKFISAFPGESFHYRYKVVSGKYTRLAGETTWNPGESFASVEALKAFLDSQPANNPNTPLKVFVRVTDQTIMNLANLIKTAGKYVDLAFNFQYNPSSSYLIPRNAFKDCAYLTGLAIFGPSHDGIAIDNIGILINLAFAGAFGEGAFINCPNLTSVSLASEAEGAEINVGEGIIFDGTFNGKIIVDGRTYTREKGGKIWTEKQ